MNLDSTPPVGGNNVDDNQFPMTVGDGVSPFSVRTEDMVNDEPFDYIAAHMRAQGEELVRRTTERLSQLLSGSTAPTEYNDTEPMVALYRMPMRKRAGWPPGAGHVTVHVDLAPHPDHRGPDGMRISLSRADGTELFPRDPSVRRLLYIAERARWRHNHLCRPLLERVAYWTQGSTHLIPGSGYIAEHTFAHLRWSEADCEGYYAALRVLQRGAHGHRATNPAALAQIPRQHPDGAPMPETPVSFGHGEPEEFAHVARAASAIAANSVRSTKHRRNEGLERERRNVSAQLMQQRCRVHDLAEVLRDARAVIVRAKHHRFICGLLEDLDQERIKNALNEVSSLKQALKVSRQMHGEYIDQMVGRHGHELRHKDLVWLGWVSAMIAAQAIGLGIARLLGVF